MVESIKFSLRDNIQTRADTLAFLLTLPVILGMFHFYIFSLWLYWDLAPEIPLVLASAVLFTCYRRLEWYIPLKVETLQHKPVVRRVHWLEIVFWYGIMAGLFWHLASHFDLHAQLTESFSYLKVMLWGYGAVLIIVLTLGVATEYLISFVSGFIERLQAVPMLLDRVVSVFLVYITVASIFAAIYRYLSLWTEQAFNQPIESTLDAFYFSVVTMTTLGYGDIHPVSPLAKGLVIFEVLCGVMLLAIMVGAAISVSFYEIDHEDW